MYRKLIFSQEKEEPKIIDQNYSEKVKELMDDFAFQMINPEKVERDGWTYYLKSKSKEADMAKTGMLFRINEDRTNSEYLGLEQIKDIITIKNEWLYLFCYGSLAKYNVNTGESVVIDSGSIIPWDMKDGYLYYVKKKYNEDRSYVASFLRFKIGEDKPDILEADVLKGKNHPFDLRVRANKVVKKYLPFTRTPSTRRYENEELDKRAKEKLGINTDSIMKNEGKLRRKIVNYIGEDDKNYYYQDGKMQFAGYILEPVILQG